MDGIGHLRLNISKLDSHSLCLCVSENDEVKEAEPYHSSSHVHAEDVGVAVGEARAH